MLVAANTLGVSTAEVGPTANSFEIDGDYGSTISSASGTHFGRVVDDGVATKFSRFNHGLLWEHVTQMPQFSATSPYVVEKLNYPYMGESCYRVGCRSNNLPPVTYAQEPEAPVEDEGLSFPPSPPEPPVKDRSEQKMLSSWPLKGGSRYFSFSMYVPDRDADGNEIGFGGVGEEKWFFFCQWWQDPTRQPPLSIGYVDNRIELARRIDSDKYDKLGDGGELVRNQWHHFLVRAEFGLEEIGPEAGNVGFWKMDLATGTWIEIAVNDSLKLGYRYKDPLKAPLDTPAATDNFTWKVGTYRGVSSLPSSILYDNIRYGRTWDHVTKNKLIGYHKNVAELSLDETTGTTANDESAYANPGTLVGGPLREAGGIVNNCVKLDGVDDHVRIPVDTTDFDFGNYMTLSGWFKSSDSPQAGKAIICTDEYSTTYKSRLYLVSGNELSFTVRHPDNTLETVQQTLGSSVLNGQWHHFVGTYNRWAPDGNRLKIYLDGNLIGSAAGADKPLLRPDNYVYAGKFSGNYFKGRIDEIGLYNYEMTAAEVAALFASP